MTRVVCVQLAPVLGDVAANRALSTAAVRAAVDDGADVVVLPELATSGYVFTDTAEAAAAAISAEDPLFDDWAAEVARSPRPGTVVVGGFAETGPGGTVSNSAALLDAGGVRAVYRKTHLWDREKLLFTPGDEVPPVVDTAHGRIGVIICYDLEFPEITRTLALGGADLIAVPTNWPLVGRPPGERPPEVQIAMAAARVNHVFIACADRTGTERGQRWTGGTALIDEQGWVLDTVEEHRAPDGAPDRGDANDLDAGRVLGTAAADVDLARARDKTWTALADVFADRRPELYGAVTRLG